METATPPTTSDLALGEQGRDPMPPQPVGATSQETDDCDPGLDHVACSCPCCTNYDVPHQPTDLEQSKAKGQQSYSRSIQPSWYKKYQWISVCTSSFKVYCHICCSARDRGLVTFSKRYNLAFVKGGFSNWKKALQRFSEHEKSEMHQEALTKFSSMMKSLDIHWGKT